jgi:GMP synthase-like glutamine amidotransferase
MPVMRILVFQHDHDSGLDALEAPFLDAGADVEIWFPNETAAPRRPLDAYDGLIVLGGLANPDEDAKFPWLTLERSMIEEALEREVPVLGICLGGQLLAQAAGGEAFQAPDGPGIGWFEVRGTEDQAEDELFGDLPEAFYAFEWHHYCFTPPEDATLIYNTRRFNQAFRYGRNAWGTQFHFEAEPETISEWIDTARDEAITHGVDIPNLRDTTAEYGPTQVELCHRVALRFVEVVGRYAGAR